MQIRIDSDKILEAIRQVSRFNKNYKYFYFLRIVSLCVYKRNSVYHINKKKFTNYLIKFRNFKTKTLTDNKNKNFINKKFLTEVDFLLKKIDTTLPEIYPNFLFFNISKTRRNIKKHIKNMEKTIKKTRPHMRKLNLKNRQTKEARLFRKLLSQVTFTFSCDEKPYRYYGEVISKIYNTIQEKLEKRNFLNFFLNSVLVISVNSSLFKGVFFVKKSFLRTKMISAIYVKLLNKPLQLNV
jgi:hypothetical protein